MTETRGLIANMSIADLKLKIVQEPYNTLWQRLKIRTREVMKSARKGNFATLSYGSLAWHSFTPMVCEAAMMWLLEDDEDALLYVEQCIDVVDKMNRCNDAIQNPNFKRPVNSHGEIALAADLCRNDLNFVCREKLLVLMREILIDYHEGAKPYSGSCGGSNIQYCQTVNAAYCALTWGETCSNPTWKETIHHAVEYTRCYLRRGCDYNGYGYEGTGYSHSVFHYAYLFVQLLYQNGICNLFKEEPALKKCIEASISLAFPGGNFLINMNDHGLLIPKSMSWLLYAAQHYNAPEFLGLWYAYEGPDSTIRPYGDVMPWFIKNHLPDSVPIDECLGMLQALIYWDTDAPFIPIESIDAPISNYSPGTEVVNFRTSWSKDAVYINLPGAGRSHASQTHRQDDAGHFSIYAYGEYLAIDTGRYNCGADQHSVMITDDLFHNPTRGWGRSDLGGRVSAYETGDMLTYACIDAAQMKECIWADRHFLFVPCGDDDCYIVIIDNINRNNDMNTLWWQMHCKSGSSLAITGDTTATLKGQNARLDLTFTSPSIEDYPDSPHEFELSTDSKDWSWPYGMDDKRPDTHGEEDVMLTSFKRPRLLGRLKGVNGQLMTVIVPRRFSQESLQVRTISQHRHLQVEVEHNGVTDKIVAGLDHHYIHTDRIKTFAELVLVRTADDGKVVQTWKH